jgi:small subunit ribosomal protein S15
MTSVEKQMLFEELPVLCASAPSTAAQSHFNSVFITGTQEKDIPPEVLARRQKEGMVKEKAKIEAFAKVIDLQNANAGGISYENRRRIILEFSAHENPFDPGRSEVQGHF